MQATQNVARVKKKPAKSTMAKRSNESEFGNFFFFVWFILKWSNWNLFFRKGAIKSRKKFKLVARVLSENGCKTCVTMLLSLHFFLLIVSRAFSTYRDFNPHCNRGVLRWIFFSKVFIGCSREYAIKKLLRLTETNVGDLSSSLMVLIVFRLIVIFNLGCWNWVLRTGLFENV